MGKKTSVYITDEIRAIIRCPPRGMSQAIAETAKRYAVIIDHELGRIMERLSQPELEAIRMATMVKTHRGWTAESIRGGVLAAVQDMVATYYDSKGIDRAMLEAKVAALPVASQVALVEWLEIVAEGAVRQAEYDTSTEARELREAMEARR